jgi:hypothetical protein
MRREDICENSYYVNSLVKQRNLSSRNWLVFTKSEQNLQTAFSVFVH